MSAAVALEPALGGRPMTQRNMRSRFRNEDPKRPMTAAEVLQGSTKESPDLALRRLLKTPRVFSRGKVIQQNCRGELRAHLLPSILSPSNEDAGLEGLRSSDLKGSVPAPLLIDEEKCEFYKNYHQEMARRTQEENENGTFLMRDKTFPPSEWDPQQNIIAKFSVLKDIVASRVGKFRRPKETLVDLGSNLPFSHPHAPLDLEELTNILTLDLEQLSVPWKNTGKNPGFTSIQLASRIPLVIKDPMREGNNVVMTSERLPTNDLHSIRLDLQPGDVRQVAYNCRSRHFKNTLLAHRMAALVDPEQAVLASLVRKMRSKEAEASCISDILSDVLRDVSSPLSPSPIEEEIDTSDDARKRRLEDMVGQSKRTMTRLLESSDVLALMAQTLSPSLAHAIDKLTLVCIREVDRLTEACHQSYEDLLKRFKDIDEARRIAEQSVVKLTGRLTPVVDVQDRIESLDASLREQERLHAALLKEKLDLEVVMRRDTSVAAQLKEKVTELQQVITSLMKDRSLVPDKVPSDKISGPELEVRNPQKLSELPKGGRRVSHEMKALPLTFTIVTGTQTETDFFFSRDAPVPEEMPFTQFDEILWTADRLYQLLCSFEWNPSAHLYLPRSTNSDSDSDGPPPANKAGARRQSAARLNDIRRLREKVKHAHDQTVVAQLEEEVSRLQALGRTQFDKWISNFMQEAYPVAAADLPAVVEPNDLFQAVLQLVDGEGMRRRIKELENHLSQLMPMADRVAKSQPQAGQRGDLGFWKRVLRSVRHSLATRRGSTFAKQPMLLLTRASDPEATKQAPTAAVQQILDLPRLLGELANIWFSLLPAPEKAVQRGHILAQPSPFEALQEGVMTYYLQRLGRSKVIEKSVFNLCRAVLDHVFHPKVGLFALMCEIQPASTMGERIPKVRRNVELEFGLSLRAERFSHMDAETPYILAAFMSEITSLRRSRKYVGSQHDLETDGVCNNGEEVDEMLPVQLILTAGRSMFYRRSKASWRFFQLMLFAYCEFTSLDSSKGSQKVDKQKAAAAPAVPDSLDEEHSDSEHEDLIGLGSAKPLPRHASTDVKHALFISNLLAVETAHREFVERDETTEQVQETLIANIWQDATSEMVPAQTPADGPKRVKALCKPEKLAAAVSGMCRLLVPNTMVTDALKQLEQQTIFSLGQVTKMSLKKLFNAWKTSEVVCREGLALWAALWALSLERQHEVDLMGELFVLFDASKDGALQFVEFQEFVYAIAPQVSEADCVSLFMCGAEESSGDMTKEAFVHLVIKVGLTSNLEHLEQLVAEKKVEQYSRYIG